MPRPSSRSDVSKTAGRDVELRFHMLPCGLSLYLAVEPQKPNPDAYKTENEVVKLFNLHLKDTKYDREPMSQPFTEAEFNKVIKELKPNKCPGEDQITNEIIKNCARNLKKSILCMMNWLFEKEELPEQLQKINIKSLYKGKGSAAEPKNHRESL